MTIEITNLETEEKIKVTFYTDIETLPIRRYQLIQKYSLIDAGIGSTLEDIVNKFAKFDHFLEAKDFESLSVERENILMNINFMLEESSTTSYLLASMVKSINGEKVEVTDENIDELVDMFECSDITFGQVKELTSKQKKSLIGA
jgi:hypothetical protein